MTCLLEFDGVEPCPICYCVVEAKAHTLPTSCCATCGAAFHSRCVLKWFMESQKAKCPICQQPWAGR